MSNVSESDLKSADIKPSEFMLFALFPNAFAFAISKMFIVASVGCFFAPTMDRRADFLETKIKYYV